MPSKRTSRRRRRRRRHRKPRIRSKRRARVLKGGVFDDVEPPRTQINIPCGLVGPGRPVMKVTLHFNEGFFHRGTIIRDVTPANPHPTLFVESSNDGYLRFLVDIDAHPGGAAFRDYFQGNKVSVSRNFGIDIWGEFYNPEQPLSRWHGGTGGTGGTTLY